jgi:hypothetical protein
VFDGEQFCQGISVSARGCGRPCSVERSAFRKRIGGIHVGQWKVCKGFADITCNDDIVEGANVFDAFNSVDVAYN